MDLNRFGLDTVIADGLESEIFQETKEEFAGTESLTEEILQNEIHELIEANESLDRMMHTGLTDGVESISETFKMIQMSDVLHLMDEISAGTESYEDDMSGLESALRYAGIDISELVDYSAGTESREGGIVQPLRSAGKSIKNTNAYKTVSNSFVGKAAGKIANTISRLWNWIKDFVFGKKSKAAEANVAKIILQQKKKYSETLASAMKEKEDAISSLTSQLQAMTEQNNKKDFEIKRANYRANDFEKQAKASSGQLNRSLRQLKKEKAENSRLRESLDNVSTQMNDEAAVHAEMFQLAKKLEKEKAELTSYIKRLENEAKDGNISDNWIEEFVELAAKNDATKKAMEKSGTTKAMDKYVSSIKGQMVGTQFEFHKSISSILSSMGYCSKEIVHAASILNKSKPNLQTSRTPGVLSETFDVTNLIGFNTGVESGNLFDEEVDTPTDGLESTITAEMMSSWDTLSAIEAGIECMNIDTFGHPYIGIDLESVSVIAFTNNNEYGEAGIEAEETASDEKPSDVAKSEESKSEGFFSKAGKHIKKAGRWSKVKARQFWVWLKSKLRVLEPLMDRLAMMTSKSFDLSILNETTLGESLATIDANLEKIAKMLDPEHKESVKSAEEYTKALAEAKKKVASAKSVSPIRLIGASDLLKKIRKVSKAVQKATENKVENAGEMATIMATVNKSIQTFSIQIRKAMRNSQKAADATKDLPEEDK